MQPNIVTIDANEGFTLTYKSGKPLKADAIAYLYDLLDILIVDFENFENIGEKKHAA